MRYRDIRTLNKKVEDRVRAERDRSCQKEKSKEKMLGESGMWKGIAGYERAGTESRR